MAPDNAINYNIIRFADVTCQIGNVDAETAALTISLLAEEGHVWFSEYIGVK